MDQSEGMRTILLLLHPLRFTYSAFDTFDTLSFAHKSVPPTGLKKKRYKSCSHFIRFNLQKKLSLAQTKN